MITINKPQITFCAKQKQDSAKNSFPIKLEFTETEKEFNEVLCKYNTVSQNAKSQKELLRSYYSASDKYDYQMLMKERSNLSKQLKRIAKKAGTDYISMEIEIISKKEYNRYAPKIFRAETLPQLEEIQKLINETPLFIKVKSCLLKIISEYKTILIK